MNKSPEHLVRLSEDYSKLASNEFWHEFLRFIEEQRLRNLEDLGRAEHCPEARLRWLQGVNEALKQVQLFPERIYNEVRRLLKKGDSVE